MSKLRTAQVIGRLGGGGAQRLAWNLAVALQQRGIASFSVALRHGGGFASSSLDTVPTVELGVDPKKWMSLWQGGRKFRHWLRERDIDVLHVHGVDCLPFCLLAMLGMRSPPRVVFTWHNSERVLAERGLKRQLIIWSLRRCAAITGSSLAVSQQLRTALGSKCDVGVLRNGVPIIAPASQPGSVELKVVWVARLVPSKEPEMLLRAAAQLHGEGIRFHLIIVGDAPTRQSGYLEALRRLLGKLHADSFVSMVGWLDDIPACLRSAHIGVQTSSTEGLSMALLEQMIAGLAIVATDVGDTREALSHGNCGIIVPPHNESALTSALRQVLTDCDLRLRLGQAARLWAMQEYSLDAMAGRALAMYRSAMCGEPHREQNI